MASIASKEETKIRVWMLKSGIRVVDVARDLDVTKGAVVHWLARRSVSGRIYNWFEAAGCPASALRSYAGKRRAA